MVQSILELPRAAVNTVGKDQLPHTGFKLRYTWLLLRAQFRPFERFHRVISTFQRLIS